PLYQNLPDRPSPRRRDRRRGWAGARHRATARGGLRGRRTLAERRLRNLADAGERAQNADRLDRQHDDLLVRRVRQLPERLDVFVGDKIIQRGDIALGNGFRHHLRRLGFGFRRAFARLGVAEGGFLAAFGLQDLALLGAFGPQDLRLPLAFRL